MDDSENSFLIMIVLGLDPGIERLGFGIINSQGNSFDPLSYGLITTESTDPKQIRLLKIYEDLNYLIEKWHPDMLAVETILFAKNVKTALTVSEVRGVILLIAALHQMSVHEFTPLKVKMTVAGYGRANKTQMQSAIKIILNLPEIPKPDDVADALSIAVCGVLCQK